MGFTCGIVGLPNVGKSTIFNALTSAKAASENFPFCTIEPNTGTVAVPDDRLFKLAKLAESAKIIPTQMTFVDIAGLIKGASKGEGLGNQFLSHIRNVDAIAHVVRCFDNPDIVHVEGAIDPVRDIEIIDTELLLADLDSISKQVIRFSKNSKSGDKKLLADLEDLKSLEAHISSGKQARSWKKDIISDEVKAVLDTLITAKPVLYVANVEENEVLKKPDLSGKSYLDKIGQHVAQLNSNLVIISGQIEAEISELGLEERKEYLKELGLEKSGLDRLILSGYNLLNLITFFTVGPKEARAWTASKGSLAPTCAGKIHSDFEKGFIRAEVISYQDYIDCGSELKAKENGKLRTEGKEYICQDGDVMHFRFNL